MPTKFSWADKAYYVAEYISELREEGLLIPCTLCERHEHSRVGEMGLAVDGGTILNWARGLSEKLNTSGKAQLRRKR